MDSTGGALHPTLEETAEVPDAILPNAVSVFTSLFRSAPIPHERLVTGGGQ